jgi:hypothetical protein
LSGSFDKEKSLGGIFIGTAKLGEVIPQFSQVSLTAQDMSSPVAMQMAMSRIYEALTKTSETGAKKKFMAEVKFADSMGNPVVLALDLGGQIPPFTSREVKAKVLVELYEDQAALTNINP